MEYLFTTGLQPDPGFLPCQLRPLTTAIPTSAKIKDLEDDPWPSMCFFVPAVYLPKDLVRG